MSDTHDRLTSILEAVSANEAFASLFREEKDRNKKWSLEYLRRRTGGLSRGHLCDVLTGRRKVPLRLKKSLTDAFELDPFSRLALFMIIDRDHAPNETAKATINRQLEDLEKLANGWQEMEEKFFVVGTQYTPTEIDGFKIRASVMLGSLGEIKKIKKIEIEFES